MALVTMKEMLEDAREKKYAVGAFDVSNCEMIKAVVDVAERLRSPVILSALEVDIAGKNLDYFIAMCNIAACKASVPVCIHMDHAVGYKVIKRVIDAGFTSVMYDGSKLSFDENVRNTKEVCEYAHKTGITVEAELGHVTDAIAGNVENSEVAAHENPSDFLTNPQEAEKFIELTKVDALAIAIGTAHGVYRAKPILDFERLIKINEISSIPLVLHGGSGTPNEEIKKAIEYGMCKINILSEVLNAFNSSLLQVLSELSNMSAWHSVVFNKPIDAMEDIIEKKIILFGSNNKV